MRRSITAVVLACLAAGSTANAATITFNTDPFAGSTALTTPGRQVVGGESFITFNIAADLFALGSSVFDVGDDVLLANDLAANLPTSDVNVIVLRSFDDDNNLATLFGAGNAANLIAARLTAPGPGFFIYFNQGLDLPRLVFSTDLNENTADLKILFRLTNLTGAGGRDAMSLFTASNFDLIPDDTTAVPEPSTLLMTVAGTLGILRRARRRRQDRGPSA
jgi:hypothetical protein